MTDRDYKATKNIEAAGLAVLACGGVVRRGMRKRRHADAAETGSSLAREGIPYIPCMGRNVKNSTNTFDLDFNTMPFVRRLRVWQAFQMVYF